MRFTRLFILVSAAALFLALPTSAAGQAGSVGIYSIAACRDSTTVAVNGSSTYSSNRLDVGVYYQEKGQWTLLRQVYTPGFGSGPFSMAVMLDYGSNAATTGETLRVDVQLQPLSGRSWVNEGNLITQTVTVADKDCNGRCSVTVDTGDRAPASGTLTLRSHFGSWFRPEGRLHGAFPVIAGQRVRVTFAGLPCNWPVRAWYYPKTGNKTPKMLPAQYWPNEFQANALGISNPYVTSFAKGLKPTSPLEAGDPYVAK